MSPIPVIRASGAPVRAGLAIGQRPRRPDPALRRLQPRRTSPAAALDRAAIEALTGPTARSDAPGPAATSSRPSRAWPTAPASRSSTSRCRTPTKELDPHADPGPWAGRAGPIPPGPSRAIERCSTLAVSAPGLALLGHNEQWLANEPGDVALVVEIPDDPAEPAVVSPTCASWRPAVGMTSTGHAQAVMSLTRERRPARDPARPRLPVGARCRDPADALARATPVERSGGYAYVHAFRGGTASVVETTATREALVDGPAVHTNHYLDPTLAALGAPSVGRQPRPPRAPRRARRRGPAHDPRGVMAILADHGSTPSTICLHPDPADGDDAEAVIFAMVVRPGGRPDVGRARPALPGPVRAVRPRRAARRRCRGRPVRTIDPRSVGVRSATQLVAVGRR